MLSFHKYVESKTDNGPVKVQVCLAKINTRWNVALHNQSLGKKIFVVLITAENGLEGFILHDIHSKILIIKVAKSLFIYLCLILCKVVKQENWKKHGLKKLTEGK